LGQAAEAFKKMLPQLIGWALLGFGASYIGFGIFNDLNWGAPWACPGPFFTATNALECITEYTMLVEIPQGAVMLVLGIVVLLVDKMVLNKD
jgi:hypothetical protein